MGRFLFPTAVWYAPPCPSFHSHVFSASAPAGSPQYNGDLVGMPMGELGRRSVWLLPLSRACASDTKTGGELLPVGILVPKNLFGIGVRNLDIGMAQASGQISDRRARSDHAYGEGMAQRVHLAGLQIGCTDIA